MPKPRSLASHILEALESVGLGKLMSVSDIREFRSKEYPGELRPNWHSVRDRLDYLKRAESVRTSEGVFGRLKGEE